MKSLDEIAAELQETAERLDVILTKLEQHKKPTDVLKQGAIIAAAGVVAATVIGKVVDKVNGKS